MRAAIPLIAIAVPGALRAAESPSPVAAKRVALSGYDPVSYFTEGHPEKGRSEFTFAFDDAIYWFKNVEHRAMFAADPEHYAPQYAGFCTITVSRGGKFEADPEAWKIWDDKLFVFGSKNGPRCSPNALPRSSARQTPIGRVCAQRRSDDRIKVRLFAGPIGSFRGAPGYGTASRTLR
jgi:hypothetical protein